MKKIIGIQGNICYEPIDISKEKLRILEDILDELYSKGSVSTFGIPVNTPLEIPRMICQSANNHSDIQISGVNSQLTVRYDNRFSNNAEKCFAYCKERMFLMQKALKEIGAKIKFSGINVQYVCEENLKSIEILKEKYPDVVEEMEKVIITMPNGEQVGRLTAQILDKIKVKRKSIRKKDEGR